MYPTRHDGTTKSNWEHHSGDPGPSSSSHCAPDVDDDANDVEVSRVSLFERLSQ